MNFTWTIFACVINIGTSSLVTVKLTLGNLIPWLYVLLLLLQQNEMKALLKKGLFQHKVSLSLKVNDEIKIWSHNEYEIQVLSGLNSIHVTVWHYYKNIYLFICVCLLCVIEFLIVGRGNMSVCKVFVPRIRFAYILIPIFSVAVY